MASESLTIEQAIACMCEQAVAVHSIILILALFGVVSLFLLRRYLKNKGHSIMKSQIFSWGLIIAMVVCVLVFLFSAFTVFVSPYVLSTLYSTDGAEFLCKCVTD